MFFIKKSNPSSFIALFAACRSRIFLSFLSLFIILSMPSAFNSSSFADQVLNSDGRYFSPIFNISLSFTVFTGKSLLTGLSLPFEIFFNMLFHSAFNPVDPPNIYPARPPSAFPFLPVTSKSDNFIFCSTSFSVLFICISSVTRFKAMLYASILCESVNSADGLLFFLHTSSIESVKTSASYL